MAFKSSKGRNTGKELEVYRSSDSGQAVGGGGGGSPVPFSATGGTKTTPGDGGVYHTFTPTPGTDTFSVATTSPAAVGGNYIEALVQGNGGAGGTGSNPGPQTKPSGGGGGGATGMWTIPITVAGDYPIKVCRGKTSAPGSSSQYSNMASALNGYVVGVATSPKLKSAKCHAVLSMQRGSKRLISQ